MLPSAEEFGEAGASKQNLLEVWLYEFHNVSFLLELTLDLCCHFGTFDRWQHCIFRLRGREEDPAEEARPLPGGARPLPPRRGLLRRHEVHRHSQKSKFTN